jgi:hypothetical protein
LTVRRLSRRGRKRALCAGVGVSATLAVLAGAAWSGAGAATATSNDTPAVRLAGAPLGIDVAPWDSVYSSPATLSAVQPLLKAAGVTQLHYGGGVSADEYDWQTNTDISNCPDAATSEFTAACAYSPALPFSKFSANARALGAQSFVTVNYGSGTPALAAAWAAQSESAAGQGVADWEIGNESYGCWENNNELADPPEDYQGYAANVSSTCPMTQPAGLAAGMEILADSYAANAKQFMVAIRAADPSAQLGVPWAFDGTVGGAGVIDNGIWNDTVLGDDGHYIGFVDAHWYPFSFGGDMATDGNPTAQTVIRSVEQIPAQYAKIRAKLNAYDPGAKVIVGETGVSYLATNVPCTPAGALFAAGDALEWLAAGAQSIDWWPLDTAANLGAKCAKPDEAMFTNAGHPNTPYIGYLLASALAQPKAELKSLTTSNPADVLAFQSVLPDGQVAVALINTDTARSEKVKVSTSLAGNLTTESYSAGDQKTTNLTTVTAATTESAIAGGITLPAESILVLESHHKPSLKLAVSATTVKPGKKVTVTATLGDPHANRTLIIYAQPKGGKKTVIKRATVNSKGRLSVVYTVRANTTFTVTFSGDSWYASASATAAVRD